MKKYIFISLLSLIAFFSGYSQNSFRAEGPTAIGVGEQFRVVYTVNSKKISNFVAPDFGEFQVVAGPMQSSSSYSSNINGVQTHNTSVTLTYILVANKEGTFTIGPSRINVEGSTLKSNALKINVSKNPTQTQRSQYQGRPQAQPSFQQNNVTVLDDKAIFVKAISNKSTAYIGQEIIITYKLYTLVPVSEFQVNKMPVNRGFWIEELDMSKDPSISEEIIDGKVYHVATLRKVIAYPQESGKLTIAPLDIDVQAMIKVNRNRRVSTGDPFFDSFFNDPFFQSMQSGYESVKKNIKSNSISVDVKPLPNTNLNFSGGIGSFSIKASANPLKCKTNEAITLRYTISGEGNLSLIDKIDLNLPEEFESYDPNIIDNYNKTQSGIKGSRTFEYIIIPRVEGRIKVPKVDFVYFDINTKQYKTISTNDFEFEIEKGKAEKSSYQKQLSEREIYKNKDIEYIKTEKIRPVSFNSFYFSHPYLYIILAIILLSVIVFIFLQNKKLESSKDVVNLRYKTARKMANRRFKKAKAYMNANMKEEFYDEVAKALWNYLLDRFKIEKKELSFDNVEDTLKSNNIDSQTIERLITLLNSCEFVRFGYNKQEEGLVGLYNESIETISQIESQIKR